MMRQVIAALLAAVAWMPVQAQEGELDGQRMMRHERAPRADDAVARPDRAARFNRPADARQPSVERPSPDHGDRDDGQRGWRGGENRPPLAAEAPAPGRQWGRRGDRWTPERQAAQQPRPDWQRGDIARQDARRFDDRRDPSGAEAVRRWENRRDDRANGRWGDDRWQAGNIHRGNGVADGRGFGGRGNWNRDWRNDRQYDWGRYRQGNRGLYRLPRYYAPSDWDYGYRRFPVGVTLFSGLWDQSYWIDDPYEYRLPPADGPYRWVRYYDDALLVDVRTGLVVDTVYDIFY